MSCFQSQSLKIKERAFSLDGSGSDRPTLVENRLLLDANFSESTHASSGISDHSFSLRCQDEFSRIQGSALRRSDRAGGARVLEWNDTTEPLRASTIRRIPAPNTSKHPQNALRLLWRFYLR